MQHYHYLHRLSELKMPTTYDCVCSKCYDRPKSVTKRTIKAHLWRDRETLLYLSAPIADLAILLQLRIDRTMELLSYIHGGSSMADLMSNPDGSRWVDAEHM